MPSCSQIWPSPKFSLQADYSTYFLIERVELKFWLFREGNGELKITEDLDGSEF